MAIQPAIHAWGIRKAFGEKEVLKGINLVVLQGESLVVLGPSGCGKSVLLKILLGLIPLDKGLVRLQGKAPYQRTLPHHQWFDTIGVVFQGSALLDSLSIWENVAFSLIYGHGMACGKAKPIALEALESVGISPESSYQYPASLSGGMQRRVALARAIITKPKLLFCDEPTAGLDPAFSFHISTLIRNVITRLGAAAITITHDLHAAEIIGDKAAFMDAGTFVWKGQMHALSQAKHPKVVNFLHPEKTAGSL